MNIFTAIALDDISGVDSRGLISKLGEIENRRFGKMAETVERRHLGVRR